MTTPEAKLVCRNVWKLFGADASGFLAAHDGQPETDAITKAGLVGAVRRVDLDVREARSLSSWGFRDPASRRLSG
jgi:glycine betaine/proline transport system ATP-binding protein